MCEVAGWRHLTSLRTSNNHSTSPLEMNSLARILVTRSIVAFAIFAVVSIAEAKDEPMQTGTIHPKTNLSASALPAQAKVSFETALHAALAHQAGSAIKGKLEVEEGSLVYSFDIVTATGDMVEVEVDAATAAILGTEVEKADDLKEHEDNKKCCKCCGEEEDDDDEKEEKHK